MGVHGGPPALGATGLWVRRRPPASTRFHKEWLPTWLPAERATCALVRGCVSETSAGPKNGVVAEGRADAGWCDARTGLVGLDYPVVVEEGDYVSGLDVVGRFEALGPCVFVAFGAMPNEEDCASS